MTVAILVPVCLFFAAWWLSAALVPERLIPACALGGLALGAVLDAFFLRRMAARAYRVRPPLLMLLYIYVSVITYGVCMGFPVSVLVPGAVAGVYVGRRLRHGGGDAAGAAGAIRRAGLFVAGVIACAAGFSAYLVLREPYAGAELARMFSLNFAVTRHMIIGLVAGGGPALVVCQYWLATRLARLAYGRRLDATSDAR
jgi:hypothetical protein